MGSAAPSDLNVKAQSGVKISRPQTLREEKSCEVKGSRICYVGGLAVQLDTKW
jgi:hypothetical protein